jgi:large subunit ribosomal protein L6e
MLTGAKKNGTTVMHPQFHDSLSQHCKIPKKTHISAELVPGQVVIILSGRFRGRRVVFLKKLETGLLLVTGPYKYNGVPLKRVNAAYVLPTNTKLTIDAKVADEIKDDFFKRIEIERKEEKDFFADEKTKKERITEERRNAQNKIDTEVKKAVDAVPMMKEYLRNRFALKNGDKPHLMKF